MPFPFVTHPAIPEPEPDPGPAAVPILIHEGALWRTSDPALTATAQAISRQRELTLQRIAEARALMDDADYRNRMMVVHPQAQAYIQQFSRLYRSRAEPTREAPPPPEPGLSARMRQNLDRFFFNDQPTHKAGEEAMPYVFSERKDTAEEADHDLFESIDGYNATKLASATYSSHRDSHHIPGLVDFLYHVVDATGSDVHTFVQIVSKKVAAERIERGVKVFSASCRPSEPDMIRAYKYYRSSYVYGNDNTISPQAKVALRKRMKDWLAIQMASGNARSRLSRMSTSGSQNTARNKRFYRMTRRAIKSNMKLDILQLKKWSDEMGRVLDLIAVRSMTPRWVWEEINTSYGDWKPVQLYEIGVSDRLGGGPEAQVLALVMRLHVSKDDPKLVAYCKTFADLMKKKATKTKLGRWITKHTDISEPKLVKEISERYDLFARRDELCSEVKFKENDDPDGWEWVYEHGHGFTSCMVYNHPNGRHLNEELHGPKHPVRAYCHPKNNLRLAYMGDEAGVFARAIVYEDGDDKRYVRSYGDDRLARLLRAQGYQYDSECLKGELMVAMRTDDGELIVPYIDGDYAYVEHLYGDDYYIVADCDDGTHERSATGIGYAVDKPTTVACDDCSDHYEEDEMRTVANGRLVCPCCLENDYTYAARYDVRFSTRRDYAYYPNDDVICCESDGAHYYAGDINCFDIYECAESGDFYHIDDMVSTSEGLVAQDRAVQLDKPDPDGNTWAVDSDTIEIVYQGETITIHEDSADDYPEDENVVEEDERLRQMRLATSLASRSNHEYHPHHFKDDNNEQATSDTPAEGEIAGSARVWTSYHTHGEYIIAA